MRNGQVQFTLYGVYVRTGYSVRCSCTLPVTYIYRALRIIDTHGTARIQPWILCLYYICLPVTAYRIVLRTEYSIESATLSIHCTLDESHCLCNCPAIRLPSPSHSIPFSFYFFPLSFRDYGVFPCIFFNRSILDSSCRWQLFYSLLLLSVLPV